MPRRTSQQDAKKDRSEQIPAIQSITVHGFKSIADERTIDVKPITILVGANSSGKSSMIQPLLLQRQTLLSEYDPGVLKLDGPDVKFSRSTDLLSRIVIDRVPDTFCCGMRLESSSTDIGGPSIAIDYRLGRRSRGFEVSLQVAKVNLEEIRLTPNSDPSSLMRQWLGPDIFAEQSKEPGWTTEVKTDRCFLSLTQVPVANTAVGLGEAGRKQRVEAVHRTLLWWEKLPIHLFVAALSRVIYIRGIRGNPELAYNVAGTGRSFPGSFEHYVASFVTDWSERDQENLHALRHSLQQMHINWTIHAKRITDTQVELQVGRIHSPIRSNGGDDLINIAYAGFGVSQALPIAIALVAAEPGQLVFIEQPEIHLHPRAQYGLAQVMRDAAKRGARIVIETHSPLILQGIQTLVAKGEIEPEDVIFHWFSQNRKTGATKIDSVEPDKNGAYGDWPVDFDVVQGQAARDYLSAQVRD